MLEEILAPTNGVFLYQEQVMRSAQVMAGYSLGGADLLRRAMGKKKPEEMAKQRDVFVSGAASNNIDEKKANEIFDLIDKFSGYGFNKSHSVAYAYVSYHTAYLKSHYPAPFMAAVLSGMMDDTDRIAFTVNEVEQMGLIMNPPNVCESEFEFTIKDKKTLFYGLGAIKGVGEGLVEALVEERQANGLYKDIFDFCHRIEKKHLNRRAIEALIYAGAFDVFGIDRAILIKTYPSAVKQAEQKQNDVSSGQGGLFADVEQHNEYEVSYINAKEFSFQQRLALEKSVMGYYFYDHPTDEYKQDLKHISATVPSNIIYRNNKDVRVLALISEIRYRATKSGGQIATIIVEDGSKQLNAVAFTKVLAQVSDKLNVDEVVVITGRIGKDFRDEWQIVIDKIDSIDEVKMSYAKSFEIVLSVNHQSIINKITPILVENKGNCPVKITYADKNIKGSIPLSQEYMVSPNNKLSDAIDDIAQDRITKIHYH